MRGKKGAIEMEKLVEIILVLVAFVVIAAIVYFLISAVSADDLQLYSCWASNGIKSSNFLFKKFMPAACTMMQPELPADEKAIAKMLKDAWWMYGKGDWNFGWSDNEEAVYYFTVKGSKGDITFADMVNYLATHKGDDEVPASDIAQSDYNYLQKGANYQTLCIGQGLLRDGWNMKAGRKYFITFFDDAGMDEKGDKLVISTKPVLEQEGAYFCNSLAGGGSFVIADDCDVVAAAKGRCVDSGMITSLVRKANE